MIEKGEYLKDITYLNRDLKKIIVIEKDPQTIRKTPNNAIYLSEYKGDKND